MIVHCSKRLAAKLPEVSPTPLEETSPIGSWHAQLFTLDRRQCVMFCHDASRYCLFIPGVRKEHFAALGTKWFRQLYLATLKAIGCPGGQIKRVELAIGPIHFDTATDRSVQGSMNIARRDLEAMRFCRELNVMELEPIGVSCRLNERPTTVKGKFHWPVKVMQQIAAELS